eukprot:739235-Pelagomonas_calceolata.AAC.1
MEALRTGQPLHARKFVRRQYKIQVRWSKRVYTRRQRDIFLGRLYSKDSDVHAMLRRSKRTLTTPVAQQSVWDEYLKAHFGLERQLNWSMGGTQNNWIPEPDAVAVPSEEEMQGLVAEQIGKMNGRASPGFDCVAAPLIKYAAVVRPRFNGWGTERVNVLVPCIAGLFKLFYDKARIPDFWKKAKLTPLYKKGSLIKPNSYRMLAVSGTMYRLYAN